MVPVPAESNRLCDARALHVRSAVENSADRDVVLLVEDDDTVATLVIRMLDRVHRRVIHAHDGAEGIRAFDQNAPSIALAILDCRLPDTDGPALCRELQRRAPGLPVLLTSGRDHSRAAVLQENQAIAFLPKPFRPADIQHKVAAMIDASGSERAPNS